MFNKNYIEFIDGLRFFSVLLVILFHFGINFNGFIGVDIFFVISGFITALILSHKKKDKKFYINFYNFIFDRIKRLFPTLIVFFLFASLTAFYHPIVDEKYFLKAIRDGFSIFYGYSEFKSYFTDSDYFNQQNFNIFYHTWSLSVELKFYLFFSFFFFLFYKKIKITKNYLIISILFYIYFLFKFEENDYFISPIRYFEIIFGSFVFIYLNSKFTKKIQKIFHYNSYYYLLIISLILVCLFNENVKILNLISVFYACITLILFCDKKNSNAVKLFFELKLIRYLGKISYIIFLFHLPILSITYLYFDGILYYSLSIVLTILISSLVYELIEKRIRNIRFNHIHKISILSILIISIIPISINLKSKNFENYVNNFYIDKENVKFSNLSNYQFKKDVDKYLHCVSGDPFFIKDKHEINLNNKCLKTSGSKILFFLVGDSFADMYLPMVDNVSFKKDIFFSSFACPYFKDYVYFYKEEKNKIKQIEQSNFYYKCQNFINKSLDYYYKLKKDYEKTYFIISFNLHDRLHPMHLHHPLKFYKNRDKYNLVNNFKNDIYDNIEILELFEKNMKEILLKMNNNDKLIFIGSPQTLADAPSRCALNFSKKNKCKVKKKKDYENFKSFDVLLKKIDQNYLNFKYFNFHDVSCPTRVCDYKLENNEVIFRDQTHINDKFAIKNSYLFERSLD